MSTYSTTNINVSSQLIVGATSSLQLTNLNSNKIINVATGSNALDAVNTGQLASATASLIKLTNTGITNSIAYFDTTNSITSSNNLSFGTFDVANVGRALYINDTISTNGGKNFILANYTQANGITVINNPQITTGGRITFRFQNVGDYFTLNQQGSSLVYSTMPVTSFKVGDSTQGTARLHITAGTTASSNAPFKLTGTSSATNLLATLENGAIEFDGTNLYYTGTFSNTQNRVKILGQTGSNAANGVAYFNDANQVKTSTNFTYNGTDLNIGASGNYIRVGGAAMIGASTTTGTNLYPVSINQITFGDQTNGNPNVINMYLNSNAAFGMSIGLSGVTASARLELRGASQSRMAPLKISATSSINLLTTTEAGAIESDANHIYYTATASGARYQLDRQGVSNYAHTIFAPTTGQTVNLVVNQYNIINPIGALLALTLNLPSSPNNNDCVYIKFTQNVTTVTYANGTVIDGITAPSAGGLTVLVYDSGTTSWY